MRLLVDKPSVTFPDEATRPGTLIVARQAGHFLCTRERFASARGGPVLVLHDTSEFVYRSEENEAIGMVSKQRTR